MRHAAVGLALALIATMTVGTIQSPTGIWIVTGEGAIDTVSDLGLEHHAYQHLGMAAVVATPDTARMLQSLGLQVWPNERYELHLDESVPRIGADRVKDAVGSARSGPTVLVIDTGLDSNHPGFNTANTAANVRAERSQSGLVTGVLENVPIVDRSGHGSHVAGIVAGNGGTHARNDPDNGRYQGVYSNGRVASFQASTDEPDPEDIAVDLAAALEGYDWAIANQDRLNIQVITNSWGSAGELAADHPASIATLKAYASGITIFFSAGNDGDEGTLNKHCLPPWVVCVAAGNLDGTRASFSSMGRPDGAPYDHPDITAPGSGIRSAQPVLAGTQDDDPPGYRERSGTSMAAPHAASTAAQLLAVNPRLSPDQVMDILVATAAPMSEETYRVGAGYLDAIEAYNLAIRTVGTRDAFLQGTEVKYAGAATGDDAFADDPVSVGYDAESGGDLDATIISTDVKPWILSSWLGPALLGTGLLLVLVGIRWRRERGPEPVAPPTDA